MSIIVFFSQFKVNVMDCISADIEEPFSNYSFDKILGLHSSNSTSFICARIKARDPKNSSKFIFSYYSAHLINKVLFQVNIKKNKKYLSRMLVLNPCTQTEIIGSVSSKIAFNGD